jgi:hypothetical protein
MLQYKNAVVVRKPTYFARHFINISASFMQGNYKLIQLQNLVCIPRIEARSSNLRVPCVCVCACACVCVCVCVCGEQALTIL